MIEGLAREHPEAGRVELWFMDEARVGQKGRLTHVWYQKGVRARGVRQQGFASAHLFGAVCPERGQGVALVLTEISTTAMGVFLAKLSRAVPAGTHAGLVLDTADWHVSGDLTVPANMTLIPLPPYNRRVSLERTRGLNFAWGGDALACVNRNVALRRERARRLREERRQIMARLEAEERLYVLTDLGRAALVAAGLAADRFALTPRGSRTLT